MRWVPIQLGLATVLSAAMLLLGSAGLNAADRRPAEMPRDSLIERLKQQERAADKARDERRAEREADRVKDRLTQENYREERRQSGGNDGNR